MTTVPAETEHKQLELPNGAVNMTVYRPAEGHARDPLPPVLVCGSVVPARDAESVLAERLVDGLLDVNRAVVTYEPCCQSTILEAFHGYTADQSVDEIESVLQDIAEHDDLNQQQLVTIGIGGGVLTIGGWLGRTKNPAIAALVLISPLTVTQVQQRSEAKIADTAGGAPPALPDEYLRTVGTLDAASSLAGAGKPMLLISGSAAPQHRVKAAHTLAGKARAIQPDTDHLLVAGGDEMLASEEARRMTSQLVTEFVKRQQA